MMVTEFNPEGTLYRIWFKDLGNLHNVLSNKYLLTKVVHRAPQYEDITIPTGPENSGEPITEARDSLLCWHKPSRERIEIGHLEGRTFWVGLSESTIFNLDSVEGILGAHFATKYNAKIHKIKKL